MKLEIMWLIFYVLKSPKSGSNLNDQTRLIPLKYNPDQTDQNY